MSFEQNERPDKLGGSRTDLIAQWAELRERYKAAQLIALRVEPRGKRL